MACSNLFPSLFKCPQKLSISILKCIGDVFANNNRFRHAFGVYIYYFYCIHCRFFFATGRITGINPPFVSTCNFTFKDYFKSLVFIERNSHTCLYASLYNIYSLTGNTSSIYTSGTYPGSLVRCQMRNKSAIYRIHGC